MFDQLLAGGATSLLNFVIHTLIMGGVVKVRIGMYGVGAQRRRNSCNTPSSSWRPEACSSPATFWRSLSAFIYAAVGAAPPALTSSISLHHAWL
jgi:hypothetical protein